MRFWLRILSLFACLLAPAAGRAEAPAPLAIGVHAPDSVTLYGPRYEGSDWQSQFGVKLKTELEDQLGVTFSRVTSLAAFPPRADAPPMDAYIVVAQTIARFYGRGTMNAEAYAAVSVYDARHRHVKDLEASTEYKAALSGPKPAQQERFEAGVHDVVRDLAGKLLAKIKDPELQARLERTAAEVRYERAHPALPKPVAAAPTAFGRLVLTTTPAGATVFLDDVYWGASNAEGRLTIAGVGVGSHLVRLKASGYEELRQSVEVAPGDNPVALRAREAGPKPLSEPEIEDALRHEVPRARVAALVREFGVNFDLTKESEVRLRDAGADGDLLLAIAQNKK